MMQSFGIQTRGLIQGLVQEFRFVSISWLLIGRLYYRGVQFAIVVVLIKLTEPTVVGAYGLAQAIGAPIFAFLHFELSRLLATDSQRQHGFMTYLVLQIIAGFFGLLIVLAIGMTCLRDIWLLLFGVGCLKAVEVVSEMSFGSLLRAEKTRTIACSLCIKGTATLVSFTVGILCFNSVVSGLLIASVANMSTVIVYDLRRVRETDQVFRLSRLPAIRDVFHLARLGLPAGVRSTLVSLNTSAPRYLLQVFWGASAVGYFVSLFQLMQVGAMINSSVVDASLSRIARRFNCKQAGFLKDLLRLLAVSGLIGAAILVVFCWQGRNLLRWIYSPEYAVFFPAAVIVLTAGAIRHMVGVASAACIGMRILVAEAALVWLTGIVGIGIGLWLIPLYGVDGAAWTLVIPSLFNLIVVGILIIRRAKQRGPGSKS